MGQVMKCGHAAQSAEGCVICDCVDVAPQPDLTGRRARCVYHAAPHTKYECAKERDSDRGMGFFKYNPDGEFDSYYCGCWGWD